MNENIMKLKICIPYSYGITHTFLSITEYITPKRFIKIKHSKRFFNSLLQQQQQQYTKFGQYYILFRLLHNLVYYKQI